MSTRAMIAFLAVIGAASVAPLAQAAVTSTVITIEVSSQDGAYSDVVSWDADTSGWIIDGAWQADLGEGLVIYARDAQNNIVMSGDTPVVLATIKDCGFSVISDPQVAANFNVQAGFFNTTFNVSSGILSFPDPDQTVGITSAGITLTGNSNGATLSKISAGTGIFQALYDGANVFANLHNSNLSVGANQSVFFSDGYGYAPIGTAASSISAKFSFSLSALDQAAGTSVFTVIPAPGSAALLGLSGLAALRRRR